MKTCPNCGELNGDAADNCFKCQYPFNTTSSGDNSNSMEDIMALNDKFEYDVVSITDDEVGKLDINKLKSEITSHAVNGWRLAKIMSDEMGQNAVKIAGFGLNATINQTILIFERRIAKATK